MDMSPFISPDPAIRRRGWSPERKLRFLERLAQCGNVRAACAAVGMTREAAYLLRRRDALFGRGWSAALVLARECSAEALGDRALDGVEEAIWHRGEQVGSRRRYDSRLLLAHLARLDRLVEEAPEAVEEYWKVREEDSPEGMLSDEEHESYRNELCAAITDARAEAGAHWDAW